MLVCDANASAAEIVETVVAVVAVVTVVAVVADLDLDALPVLVLVQGIIIRAGVGGDGGVVVVVPVAVVVGVVTLPLIPFAETEAAVAPNGFLFALRPVKTILKNDKRKEGRDKAREKESIDITHLIGDLQLGTRSTSDSCVCACSRSGSRV